MKNLFRDGEWPVFHDPAAFSYNGRWCTLCYFTEESRPVLLSNMGQRRSDSHYVRSGFDHFCTGFCIRYSAHSDYGNIIAYGISDFLNAFDGSFENPGA